MQNPYAKLQEGRDPREVIQGTPGRLKGIAERLGAEAIERAPAPGKWSAREIFCHLADAEIAFGFRIRQTLAEPHHVLQAFDQDAWGRYYGSAALDAGLALQAFSAARRWNVALLDAAQPGDFSRKVTHPERGEMTLQTIVETMAGHDLHHLDQLGRMA